MKETFPESTIEQILTTDYPKLDKNRIEKLLEIIDKKGDIDYTRGIKAQLAYFNPELLSSINITNLQDDIIRVLEKRREMESLPELTNFNGLPFRIYDSHRHSCNAIKNYLKSSGDYITIIRLDAHPDLQEPGYSIQRNNYLSHLLHDKEIGSRIIEVINVLPVLESMEELQNEIKEESRFNLFQFFKTYCGRFVGKTSVFDFPLGELPEIYGPTIIDVDIDFFEEARTYPVIGGYIEMPDSKDGNGEDFIKTNQELIQFHPAVAANILRERVMDPSAIYIATERCWRNRLFHHKIEYDFLKGLID